VDCIVANSQPAADFAIEQEQADPELFRVIHNGVSIEDFTPDIESAFTRARYKIPNDKLVVGIVANFTPVKDYSLFAEIARELLSKREDVHFVTVGAGPEVKDIWRKLKEIHAVDNFTRIEVIDGIKNMYSMFDVFVLCSKMEGFPNAVIEAMAAGLPVVVPVVGGITEMVENHVTGRLIDSREPKVFAEAIASLLDDPETSALLAGNARAFVRDHLSVEQMAAAFKELYNELLVRTLRAEA